MTASAPTPSAIEIATAWDAALAANGAFEQMKQAETDLGHLRAVGNLGLAGVTIEDTAYAELEGRLTAAQDEFGRYGSLAAPLMTMEQSPFASEPAETDEFRTGLRVRTQAELTAFAEARGYPTPKGRATSVFNALSRWEGAETLVVGMIDDTALPPEAEPGKLLLLSLPYDMRERVGEGEAIGVDIQALYEAVSSWLEEIPDIPSFGPRGISLFADYLNHAMPAGTKRLSVTHPPENKPRKKPAEVLSPRELLFDSVQIEDEELLLVSQQSLKRFVVARGVDPRATGAFTQLFHSIANLLRPGVTRNTYYQPERVGEDVFFAGSYTTASSRTQDVWGITPARFIALIQAAEESEEAAKLLTMYSGSNRDHVLAYVAALEEFFTSQAGDPQTGE